MLDTFAKNLTNSLARFANVPANDALYHVIQDLVIAQDSGQDSIVVTDTTLASLCSDFPELFGDDESDTPLVVVGHRISTRRTEQNARHIAAFFHQHDNTPEFTTGMFDDITASLDIWQKVAVFACAHNRVTLITGGAGTGKTTTLISAVMALLSNNAQTNIMLTAPTGKAVKRLQHALTEHQLDLSCKTLHQLLGMREDTATPYFHAKRQLDCDVLVIDEASMVGQNVFSLAMDALPQHAKLILLGDDNQLPPVNAAPVFHPVVRQPFGFSEDFKQAFSKHFDEAFPAHQDNQAQAILIDHHVKLHKTFRFGDTISVLANAVLSENLEALQANTAVKMPSDITQAIVDQIEKQINADTSCDVSQLLMANVLPTILCVTRQGHVGTKALNSRLDELFRHALGTSQTWYLGRKILIEKNDYELGVFNGDIGTYVGAGDVQFDGERRLRIEQLPPHSLAFAITIHKSQGSEYDAVLIAFSSFNNERVSTELITKDMLYTAITRAKQQVTIYTDTPSLTKALQTKPQTHSRVNDLLK